MKTLKKERKKKERKNEKLKKEKKEPSVVHMSAHQKDL